MTYRWRSGRSSLAADCQPEAPRYSSIELPLVMEMISASTLRPESTQRKAACAKVAPPFSNGRMSLRRAPIRVFMATTPTPLAFAFWSTRGRSAWRAMKSNERVSPW